MSVPVAAQTAVSFPARRSPLRTVEDAPLATVRDISTAPSARRRVEAQRVDDPSYLRTPLVAALSPARSRRSFSPWGLVPSVSPSSPQPTTVRR